MEKVHPFRGSLDGKQYIFDAPDGNVDRLTAVYQPEPVTLPETTRPGWSFGGWYYDSEFRRPAGGAGDSIIPSENTTLYAQWVDLTLLAKDNYKETKEKERWICPGSRRITTTKRTLFIRDWKTVPGCGLIVQRISTAERPLN